MTKTEQKASVAADVARTAGPLDGKSCPAVDESIFTLERSRASTGPGLSAKFEFLFRCRCYLGRGRRGIANSGHSMFSHQAHKQRVVIAAECAVKGVNW